MSKKPNLIFIFADQLAYNRLGYNGDKVSLTPFIDSLSKNSLVVDNCVSGHPVCAPYRASLLTGKYTTSTGMVINEIRLSTKHKSIAHVLNDEGYHTSYMGKWHLYAAQLGHHYDPKNSYIPVGDNRLGFSDFIGYNFHHEYYAPNAYYHLDTPEKHFVDGYEPDVQVSMALDTLKNLKEENKPFAFFLSIGTPHDPWIKENVPEEYYNKFKDVKINLPENYLPYNDYHADLWAKLKKKERIELPEWIRCYYAMVNNLDDNIKRLYEGIEKLDLFKDSVVVFTSDHGELFGAHGRRAKNIFYDEAVRVPFLIKYDPLIKNGKTDAVFNTVDIMPTLLGLLGINSPKEVEGKNRLDELLGKVKQDEYEGSLMMCCGPTAIYGNGREWRAYRTKQYTYAIFRSDRKELLFDNINDPLQMHNLVKDPNYKEIYNILKSKMYEEMNRIGDDFEPNSFYKHHWIKNRLIKDYLPRRSELHK